MVLDNVATPFSGKRTVRNPSYLVSTGGAANWPQQLELTVTVLTIGWAKVKYWHLCTAGLDAVAWKPLKAKNTRSGSCS